MLDPNKVALKFAYRHGMYKFQILGYIPCFGGLVHSQYIQLMTQV